MIRGYACNLQYKNKVIPSVTPNFYKFKCPCATEITCSSWISFKKITFHLITNTSESKCKRHLLCTNFLCNQYAGEEIEAVKITLGLTLA